MRNHSPASYDLTAVVDRQIAFRTFCGMQNGHTLPENIPLRHSIMTVERSCYWMEMYLRLNWRGRLLSYYELLGCTLTALFTASSEPLTLTSIWYSPMCFTLSLSLTPTNRTSSSATDIIDASRFCDKFCLIIAATSAADTLPKSACDPADALDVSWSFDPESMTSLEKSKRGGSSLPSNSTDLSGYLLLAHGP